MTQYTKPDISLLETTAPIDTQPSAAAQQTAEKLKTILADCGILGFLSSIRPGPAVTTYVFSPKSGSESLFKKRQDIARALGVESIYISRPVCFAPVYLIEVPNENPIPIRMGSVLADDTFTKSDVAVPVALDTECIDLAKVGSVLITGNAKSGKSMFLHSIIMSLVYRFTPDECKLMIIDTKGVDFGLWHDIPHLATPIMNDAGAGINALKWVVREIDRRNKSVETRMPYLTVIVDELADLMAVAQRDIDTCVQRIARRGAAVGIYLVMATGQADENTITDVIRGCIPTRMSFHVQSEEESIAMFEETGAENLTRFGDAMLRWDMIKIKPQGDTKVRDIGNTPFRVHTAYVSDDEINAVAEHLRAQGAPEYIDGVTDAEDTSSDPADLYEQARDIVINNGVPEVKYIKRRLNISYTKVAALLDRMQDEGIVSAPDANSKRHLIEK